MQFLHEKRLKTNYYLCALDCNPPLRRRYPSVVTSRDIYYLCFSPPDEDCPEEGLTVLHAGLHEFAFSFNLPQMALATSFEGKHGSVRYWVKAELHRPWLLPVKVKKEFIVFEHIDINTPLLLSPQAGSKEKTLCCWFCASGPISLSAKIERKGYTPGESIQIFCEVENSSSRVVVPKAALYQTQTFFAKGKGKQIQQLVSNLRGETLPQGKSQSWEGRLLKIPPVSPSILDCPIIRVEYVLVVDPYPDPVEVRRPETCPSR
ncbi:hypothetical protein KUCAC02_033592 [Chaenocephalus aceratus]|nr:hypothetical protein KUCAC02_033592 [Chaenocephalus aceratus]